MGWSSEDENHRRRITCNTCGAATRRRFSTLHEAGWILGRVLGGEGPEHVRYSGETFCLRCQTNNFADAVNPPEAIFVAINSYMEEHWTTPDNLRAIHRPVISVPFTCASRDSSPRPKRAREPSAEREADERSIRQREADERPISHEDWLGLGTSDAA